jgi:thioesterase domain-containing protein/acyl carrier protein
MPRDLVERELQRLWMEILRMPPMEIQQDFFELGGDSMLAARLCLRVEQEFSVQVHSAMVFEMRTIEAQAEGFLRGHQPPREWSSIVSLQSLGSRPPIFFFHTHGGTAGYSAKFIKYLGTDQPSYGVHSQGLSGAPAHLSVEEMAQHYVRELRSARPAGPYFLFGYCSGGLVAFEVARQLVRQRQEVAFLGMFNTPAPGFSTAGFWRRLSNWRTRMQLELRAMRSTHTWDAFKHVLRSLETSANCALGDLWTKARTRCAAFLRLDATGMSQVFEMSQINATALRNYRPANGIPASITFFATPELRSFYASDPIATWNSYTMAGMDIVALSDNPASLAEDLHGRTVAARLRSCVDAWLEESQGRSGEKVLVSRR